MSKTKQVEAGGRVFIVKKLSAVDRMKLAELGLNFSDEEVKGLAYVAASVTEIDGIPFAPLRTKENIYNRIEKIEDDLGALAVAFGEMNGEDSAKEDIEAAKN